MYARVPNFKLRAKLIMRMSIYLSAGTVILYLIFGQQNTSLVPENINGHIIQTAPANYIEAISDQLLWVEHSSIDTRGKFQQQRVNTYCSKYFSNQSLFPAEPSYEFKRHLMFDDRKRILFCFLPKVGCTNLKRLMLYIGGHLPLDTLEWDWVDDQAYLEPALNHASFLNKSLTHNDRIYRIKKYYKFMILRNPLERLVSAFRNKIESPLQKGRDNIGERVKRIILKKYRKPELVFWERTAYTHDNISVRFPEYVRYIVETDVDELNEHFVPSLELCHPCIVKFNFYGNFRTLSSDVKQIMEKFGVQPAYYKDVSLHTPDKMTTKLLPMYYRQLSQSEKARIFAFLYNELAFYYTLYPSENSSHTELLVDSLVF